MSRPNPPAEKAKEVSRAAHAEEIARWRERLAHEEQEHSITLRDLADAKARAGWNAILVFVLAAALILSIPAHVAIRSAMQDPPQAWREDTYSAPPLQRVTVITTAFRDREGSWRTFDNGEPVNVKYWKPQ